MKPLAAIAFTTLLATLAGCATSTDAVKPCCYDGPVSTARLQSLPVTLEDGTTATFDQAFPGFTPQPGLITRSLPFDEVERQNIVYRSLDPLLPLYDANGDGQLEKPEVVVLYAREAALALGTEVKHFGSGAPVKAVSTANADIAGLVAWVDANRSRMNERGQTIFRDLDRLGQDLKTRGSEGGLDQDAAVFTR